MDRENVINRMETICNICKENTWRTEFSSDTIYPLLRDAISLLKENETKKVTISQMNYGMKYGLCPQCGKQIDTLVNPNYCGYCGQELMWNG